MDDDQPVPPPTGQLPVRAQDGALDIPATGDEAAAPPTTQQLRRLRLMLQLHRRVRHKRRSGQHGRSQCPIGPHARPFRR
jgi:hypothetical protein